jgi:hypothetical protein
MIEQTRVFEIFDRVLFHYLHGEQLPPATGGASAGCVRLRTCCSGMHPRSRSMR